VKFCQSAGEVVLNIGTQKSTILFLSSKDIHVQILVTTKQSRTWIEKQTNKHADVSDIADAISAT